MGSRHENKFDQAPEGRQYEGRRRRGAAPPPPPPGLMESMLTTSSQGWRPGLMNAAPTGVRMALPDRLSERVGRERLAAGPGRHTPPDSRVDRVLDEADVAVAEEDVDAAGVEAPGGLPARVVIGHAIGPAVVRRQEVVVERVEV